jgi:hypothetical protein
MTDSLPVLISALARARRGHPQRHLIMVLIQECKRYDSNPDKMRPKILWTLDKLSPPKTETAA